MKQLFMFVLSFSSDCFCTLRVSSFSSFHPTFSTASFKRFFTSQTEWNYCLWLFPVLLYLAHLHTSRGCVLYGFECWFIPQHCIVLRGEKKDKNIRFLKLNGFFFFLFLISYRCHFSFPLCSWKSLPTYITLIFQLI